MDKLFSSKSKSAQPVWTFTIDSSGETISCSGRPVFQFTTQKSEPHLTISRLPPPGPWSPAPIPVGTCTVHKFPSSKVDVTLHGHEFLLKRDFLKSDNHHFDYPPLGHFKWKPDAWGGSKLELFDNERRLLARYNKKVSLKGQGQQIEVLVQGDERFVEMVVVTAMAMRHYIEVENKDIKKVTKILDGVGEVMGG
ncbi:hypothetical protein IFM51744_07896 [Aspergillus udagawae]|nr:hypothetical protein IFM51744_07896 [Aspergillus udagawae]